LGLKLPLPVLLAPGSKVLNFADEAKNLQTSWNYNRFDSDTSNTSAVFGANPSSANFYRLWMRSAREDTLSSATVLVSLVYVVELSEPNDLSTS